MLQKQSDKQITAMAFSVRAYLNFGSCVLEINFPGLATLKMRFLW